MRRGLLVSIALCLCLLATLGDFPARAEVSSIEQNFSCTYPNALFYYPDTLQVIWKPLATLPSLVRPGDTLTVWANASPAPATWSASLRMGAYQPVLIPVSANFDLTLGWWLLKFQVPALVPEELYDLQLASSTGLADTTRHSVKVLPSYRSDYYFAQVSDTHLPEHTTSSTSSFSTCDTTGMGDFSAVIADLNLIHPEFILHTGDLVNEGDLDTLYQMNEMPRALRMIYRLRDPMFVVPGNHDIGGWNATPVPIGTSRLDWRRFFGWPFLGNPPSGLPLHSQMYTFDYDSLRVFGIETYLNYDNYQSALYGSGSLNAESMNWLTSQIAAASGKHKLLFYHFDFDQGLNTGSSSGPWQLNIPSLGVDGAIWGHYHTVPENTVTLQTAKPFNLGCQAVIDGKRTFRIFRVHNGNISPGIMHHSGTTIDSLSVAWSQANDGTATRLTATVNNRFGEAWEQSRLVFFMVDHDSVYGATGGSVVQTLRQGGMIQVYVDCSLQALGNTVVSVFPTTPIQVGVGTTVAAGLRLERPSPNPLGGGRTAEIRYAIPTAGMVRLGIYDVRGREVSRLVDGSQAAGDHTVRWGRAGPGASSTGAGVYLVRLEISSGVRTRKLVLTR